MKLRSQLLLILGMAGAFLSHARASDDFECQMVLKGVLLGEYVDALRKVELTPKSLDQAERDLAQLFSEIPWFTDPRLQNAQVVSSLSSLFQEFHIGVSASVRGLDELANVQADNMQRKFRDAGIEHITSQQIKFAIDGIAESPKIYPAFSMAEYLIQRAPSVEVVFLHMLQAYPQQIMGGPRQGEMVRSVLQYSLTKPRNRALEIGHGTPIVMLALRYFTSMNLVGVDLAPVNLEQKQSLASADIQLVSGKFPDDEKTRVEVSESGPYTVIYALDTIKKKDGILKTAVPPAKYARQLYSLLDDGGTVIILNDYGDEPYFTKQQAEEAGFTVVRWRRPRKIPPELKQFIPYDPKNLRAGNMVLFVLRKGGPRIEYLDAAISVKSGI